MKHTAKRRAFAQRPFPIRITPFLEHPKKSADFSGTPFSGVANRRSQQRRIYDIIRCRPLSIAFDNSGGTAYNRNI